MKFVRNVHEETFAVFSSIIRRKQFQIGKLSNDFLVKASSKEKIICENCVVFETVSWFVSEQSLV